MSKREPLFWNPVPWRYEKGTIWDASGDSVLETLNGRPYVEPDVGEAIVTAVNLHFGGSMSLEPYQERVVEEKRQLDEKLAKLENFIFRGAEKWFAVPANERLRMTRQFCYMSDYSAVLAERIAELAKGNH